VRLAPHRPKIFKRKIKDIKYKIKDAEARAAGEINLSKSRRNPNDRQTWAKENSDLIVIVVLLLALMVFKFRFAIADWVHTENTEVTENACASCLLPSAYSDSSPSSGTIGSTPGRSFFLASRQDAKPQRENCAPAFCLLPSAYLTASSSLHGDLFSPLLTTDDRSIPTCSGPSADRRLNHSSRQDAKTQRRDQNIKDQRSKLWTARWIGPGV
jgi:hypothetical protein